MAICCNRRRCKQHTSHVTFFLVHAWWYGTRHWLKCHVSCAWVIVCSLSDPHFALFICHSHLPLHPPKLWLLPFHLPCGCLRRSNHTLRLRQMRSLALWSTTFLSLVMNPTSSTTTTTQRPLKISSRSNPPTRGPRTCMTRRSVTTPSAERSLHHCSLKSEKIQRARRQPYHSPEESLLSSRSLSVGHVRTKRPVFDEFGSLSSSVRENPSHSSEN